MLNSKTERLVAVLASHVHCKCGNVSETVQDRDVINCYDRPVIGNDIMVYGISGKSDNLELPRLSLA